MSNMQNIRGLGPDALAGLILTDGEVVDTTTLEGQRRLVESQLVLDLKRIDVCPFIQSEVADYQHAKVAFCDKVAEIGFLLRDALVDRWTAEGQRTHANAIFLIVGLLVTVIAAMIVLMTGQQMLVIGVIAVIGYFVPRLFMMFVNFIGNMMVQVFAFSRWSTHDIEVFTDYTGIKIPKRIQKLSDLITANTTGTALRIESFKRDPFLVVYHKEDPSVFFTVAGWDEGRFHTASF